MTGGRGGDGFASDADLTHPWVARYRIPLVGSVHPTWFYEVALVVPDTDTRAGTGVATWPSEEEAAVIGSFIDFRRSWYTSSHAAQMLTRPLDVDASTNTIVLVRQQDGWAYRARTWELGGLRRCAEPGTDVAGLVALLDLYAAGSRRWQEWKTTHPDLFAAKRR